MRGNGGTIGGGEGNGKRAMEKERESNGKGERAMEREREQWKGRESNGKGERAMGKEREERERKERKGKDIKRSLNMRNTINNIGLFINTLFILGDNSYNQMKYKYESL